MTLLAPNVQPPRHIIDPVAFFVALIGAPLVFALFTFWAFLIPVVAVAYGGPLYLIFGTPILLWVLSKRDPSYLEVTGWSLVAVILICLGCLAMTLIDSPRAWINMAQFFGGFGLIFAPAWSATFLALYRSLRRDFYAQARPYS